MPIPTQPLDIQRYCHTAAGMHRDSYGAYVKWAEVDALLVQRAQAIQELEEEFDRLFQAVEGYRCGSLNRDGLMHYYEIARQFRIALSGPAGGARGEADARERDAGTPQSTGALDPACERTNDDF